MSDFVLWKGNRNPSIVDTIKVAGAAQDLSGDSVKLQMRDPLDPDAALKVDSAAGFVTDGSDGQVIYNWASADVDTAGTYVAWWRVTSGSKSQDSDEFIVAIREHGLASANLCSLADVREGLRVSTLERFDDDLALALIPEASKTIMDELQREFAPATATATRRFRVRPDERTRFGSYLVDLSPYDLRTASAVSLHPEETSPTTLTAGTDYVLGPEPADEGVYTALQLYGGLSLSSTLRNRFGFAYLDITGAWGFAAPPANVKRAAKLCVLAWMDRAVAEYAFQGIDEPRAVGAPPAQLSLALPLASRRLLNSYRRGDFF